MKEINNDIIVIPADALKDNNTLQYDEKNPEQGIKQFAKIDKQTGKVILYIRNGCHFYDDEKERSFIKISYFDESLIGLTNPPKNIVDLIKDKESSNFFLYEGTYEENNVSKNVNVFENIEITDVYNHMVARTNVGHHFIYPICSYLVLISEYEDCLDVMKDTEWLDEEVHSEEKSELLTNVVNLLKEKEEKIRRENKKLKEDNKKKTNY